LTRLHLKSKLLTPYVAKLWLVVKLYKCYACKALPIECVDNWLNFYVLWYIKENGNV
jgi:hypothetical protein